MLLSLLLAVSFSWNAVTNAYPPVQGYRIYYGTASGQQSAFVDAGNQTTGQVTGLQPGARYYFVCLAYNAAGESGPSNEVSWVEPLPSPTPTPTPTPSPTPSSDVVRWFPRQGYTGRMWGGQFQGANNISGPWTTLYIIPQGSPALQWYQASVSLGGHRYLRYLAPINSWGSVAEIEFWRAGVKLSGPIFGTPGSWNNKGNTIEKAMDGSISTFWDAPTGAEGNHVGIDTGFIAPTPTPTPTPQPRKLTVSSVREYQPGTQVQISAPAPPAGHVFDRWTGDTQILANPTNAETTATIPTTLDVSVSATYHEQ